MEKRRRPQIIETSHDMDLFSEQSLLRELPSLKLSLALARSDFLVAQVRPNQQTLGHCPLPCLTSPVQEQHWAALQHVLMPSMSGCFWCQEQPDMLAQDEAHKHGNHFSEKNNTHECRDAWSTLFKDLILFAEQMTKRQPLCACWLLRRANKVQRYGCLWMLPLGVL